MPASIRRKGKASRIAANILGNKESSYVKTTAINKKSRKKMKEQSVT